MSSSAPVGSGTFFADRSMHAGIKHALAGLIAFYCALRLQLPLPNWAVLSVMMLMISDYVGAIAEKAVLRAVGTVAGAIFGVWLAGNFMDSPVILLSACFGALAFGILMFGGTLFPYAFFLGAVTVAVVIADSMSTPSHAWQVGMNRILEICLGIAASVLVSSLVWPRLAREEFQRELSHAMVVAKQLVVGGGTAGACNFQSDETRNRIQATFMQHLNKLRNLLHFGARESRFFAARAESYEKLTFELSVLFEAAISIGRDKCFRDSYGPLVGAPLQDLHRALADEFDALGNVSADLAKTNPRIEQAIEACDARFAELVKHKATKDIEFQEVLDFTVYYTAVMEISRRLGAIRSILSGLPAAVHRPREARPASLKLTEADLKNGCKGGLAVVAGLVLANWLQPPGGPGIPLTALLFTVLPKMNPAGGGDVGAFGRAIKLGLVALVLIPVLLVLLPFLSNPLWMVLFILVGMFIFGVWSFRIGGMNGWSIAYLLFFCGILGLNPQEPVGFQSIFDMAAGTALGIGVASFVQRFVWPILPQKDLLRAFAEYYEMCTRLLAASDEKEIATAETQIAMFAAATGEKLRASRGILRKEDAKRLSELTALSQRLGFALLRCRLHGDLTRPGGLGEFAEPLTTECHAQFRRRLEALAEYFRSAESYAALPSALPAALALEKAIAEWRKSYLEQRVLLSHEHIMVVATTQANLISASLVDEVSQKAAAIPLSRYSGDYYL